MKVTVVAPPTLAQALRRAAVRATLAPSVYNTQPWRFVLSGDALEVYADATRELGVLDPAGRQMVISCGCALFNARVSLHAAGYRPIVERYVGEPPSALLARVKVDPAAVGESGGDASIGVLDAAIESRHTNRRPFTEEPVSADMVDIAVAAATAEGGDLMPITRWEDRLALAMLHQQVDERQNADPAYRAELRTWTGDQAGRVDGVAAVSVPHADSDVHDDLPIRRFDSRGAGSLPAETESSRNQCLMLLGTDEDGPAAWLRAGEALERVLLELTRHGYAASPLTQAIEEPYSREMVRRELSLTMHPHVLLRVGRAASTPATRRRRLVDVLTESQ